MPFIIDAVSFEVSDDTIYSLTISIGGGITGGATTLIDFNSNLHSPTVVNVPLGNGRSIRGKSLPARSTFADDGPSQFVGVDYTLNAETKTLSRDKKDDRFWTFKTTVKFV